MKNYILKRPMLLSAMLCIFISVIGFYSGVAVATLGIFYTVLAVLLIFKGKNIKAVFVLTLSIIVLISLLISLGKAAALSRYDGVKRTAKAVVCEVDRRAESYNSAVLQIKDTSSLLDSQNIYGFYSATDLKIGQIITADFKFSSVEGIYKASSYSKNIFLTANLSNIEIMAGEKDFLLTAVGSVRNYISETLFSNMSYNEAATVSALLSGDTDYFSREFYSNVKGAGVSHVMVVSGMHLSVLVLFVLKITELFGYNRFVRAFAMLTVVLILTSVCGFTMSILRAGITYLLMAIALIIDREGVPVNTLSASVVIILIASPFAIFSVAFQLSVLSTLGILAVAVPIINYCESRNIVKQKPLKIIFSMSIATLSAMLMTLPISIYVFGFVSTVAVISNLLISYAVTLALSIGVLALLINLVFSPLASLLFMLCEVVVKYINGVINYLGSTPFSTVNLPKWTAFLAVAVIIIIFYLLLACKNRVDMIKLKEIRQKTEKEGGKRLKWQ